MKKLFGITAIMFFGWMASSAYAAPQCSAQALLQAKRLLNFHVDGDDRIEISRDVKQLAPITSPVNKNQKFQVLEVMGYIYKADYRMRLIYHHIGNECVLMGQEVLGL